MAEGKDKYAGIIGLPHHVSRTRPQMSMADRAGQFAPFAALTGYDDVIRETGRLTDDRIEPAEEVLSELNRKLPVLMENLKAEPEILFTVFEPDTRKAGGSYRTISGNVKKIDDYERLFILSDGTKIAMDNVIDIDGEIFLKIE